jgi:replicative DNA helicase
MLTENATEADLVREAEEFVVSIALQDTRLIDRMSAKVGAKSFLDETLANIWQLIVDVRDSGQPATTQTVLSECVKRNYIQDLGGRAAFANLVQKAPNTAHADYYSEEVARFSEIRTLRQSAQQLLYGLGESQVDPQKALQQFEARVDGIGSSKDGGFVSLSESVSKIVDKHQQMATEQTDPKKLRISTGLPTLDETMGGFVPGKLYLIGGRTGMGKTAIAVNMALAAARQKKSVWFCSLEMEAKEITQRVLSANLEIEYQTWRNRLSEQEIAIVQQWREMTARKLQFWITDRSESFTTLKAKTRLRKSLDGIDIVIIDNLQLVRPLDYRQPKHERLKALTEAFKNSFAKELEVAVVLLCQLSVDAEPGKEARDPDNTSWADSKRIVDDADAAMILHRPNKNESKLIVTKNRSGPLSSVKLHWDPERQRFLDNGLEY